MNKIFINGKIFTMEDDNKEVEAFCVKDGYFQMVGKNIDVLALKTKDDEIIDLNGKTVLPAFTDSHMHVLSLGMLLKDVNLNKAKSISQLVELGKTYILDNDVDAGEWIRGRGWNQDNFQDESRFITRYDLDKISTEHPIAFTRTCGHVIVVNSKALKIMGMEKAASLIDGGQIDLDEKGIPLGIFREMARKVVLDAIPEKSKDEIKALIKLTENEAFAHGITEIHSDDFKDVPTNYQKVIDAYTELEKSGELKLRVYQQCNLPSIKRINKFFEDGYYAGWGSDHFKLGPLKLLSDGALGARTALLNKPYADEPNSKGIALFEYDELNDMVELCHKNNMQIAIHAIGDKAVDMVLSCIKNAKEKYPRIDERHGIIHCQITNPQQIKTFKELDIIAYVQPIFLNYDIDIVEERLGEQRASNSYAWKSFKDAGVMLIGGSDCPVESLNVMENIYAGVTRKNLKGMPLKGWCPNECLDLNYMLKMFTINPAFASFSENIKGSIKVGKLADFIVLDNNIFDVEMEDIKNIIVEQTYVDGELVYSKPS